MAAPQPNTPQFPTMAKAISASDADIFQPAYIYVGTGGDVAVKVAHDATAVVFHGIPNGGMVPVMCVAVKSTGTTASGFVACW